MFVRMFLYREFSPAASKDVVRPRVRVRVFLYRGISPAASAPAASKDARPTVAPSAPAASKDARPTVALPSRSQPATSPRQPSFAIHTALNCLARDVSTQLQP